MRVYLINGEGTFTGDDGQITKYAVNKLVLANSKTGQEIEVKLDKLNRRLLPALFKVTPTDTMTQDFNGVQCKVLELED